MILKLINNCSESWFFASQIRLKPLSVNAFIINQQAIDMAVLRKS